VVYGLIGQGIDAYRSSRRRKAPSSWALLEARALTTRCSRTGQTAPLTLVSRVRKVVIQQCISPAAELGR
jgi:hypothetical protein